MRADRRDFLRGAAVTAAGAAAFAGTAFVEARDAATAQPSGRTFPFEGAHQAGIVTVQQQAASFCSFDLIVGSAAELRELLGTLTARIRFLTAGGRPQAADVQAIPADSGTLGPVVPGDGLTVTVGVGASLFDARYGIASRKPARLEPMPVFPDDLITASSPMHGDVSLQICADSRDTVMHALRDIAKHTRGGMQARWKIDGFHAAPRPSGTQRNQLGFKDGIANPAVTEPAVADALLWTHGGDGEPAWTEGGSYQVIRIIRMLVEFWDRVSLQEQQQMIGRYRDSGAPLDGSKESDIPDYKADPQGLVIPLDAHIRLSNPRTPATAASRILRRGYNYDRGFDDVGNLDVGLVFCCYQQDVARQFQVVQGRLAGEPLVDYIKPTGGGYFFALPGVRGPGDYLGSGLV
ncbi:MAG TPA: iron uptake transporter deferrochelatase/peroxidase subunit [Trebonia sp.]|nr:iron uptake transporter deferrochelatase/peroxidase subunit [Trebonia sp.]